MCLTYNLILGKLVSHVKLLELETFKILLSLADLRFLFEWGGGCSIDKVKIIADYQYIINANDE